MEESMKAMGDMMNSPVFKEYMEDPEKLEESRQMLGNMLSHEDLKGTPLLVFANKSDLPAAKGAAAIAGDIDLTGAVCDSRAWHIGACSALTGDGLDDGIKWLLGKV